MKTKFKTSRCRMGACLDPRLPEVPWCAACRRIGVRRRRAELAKRLAGSVPHTQRVGPSWGRARRFPPPGRAWRTDTCCDM